MAKFTGLEALVQTLESGAPSQRAFEAVRAACERAKDLRPNSAAQLYIWLRHFVAVSPVDFRFDRISEVLTTEHVVELLRRADLLPYLKIRLATCHLAARAFNAQMRLGQALAAIGTQKQLRSPILASAITSAKAARDSALDELMSIVNQFDNIETEANDANLPIDMWACRLERVVKTVRSGFPQGY
jgi:hypothetical protein